MEPPFQAARIAPLVALGSVVATPGALEALKEAGVSPSDLLRRHQWGDWGTLSDKDKRRNDQALALGERILSAYPLPDGQTKIWIITEWDRSVTTLLLPSEY